MIAVIIITTILMLYTTIDASADIDTIVPYPKEIRAVGDAVTLDGFSIVADACERAQIGADEINQRISSLGGQPIPVLEMDAKLPNGNLIVIAPCTSSNLEIRNLSAEITPSDPEPQGYIIKSTSDDNRHRLFLVGSDTLGTLYAAVTCRQLIVKRDGALMLQPAEVRDWPDYKYRLNGMPFNEPLRGDWYTISKADREGDTQKARELAADWIASQKRFFDWMLRAKINMAWNTTNYRPGNSPENLTVVPSMLKEIHEYGLKRGIECMASDTTAIGNYPQDKDNPDFQDVVYHRSHKRYFCWSRLEYHEKRAKRAAKWLADCGYTGYYIHATDGGGWQNPALWDNRCQLCRETYGDDHAKADATVFGIYHREIKKRIPNLKFVAVVYPYNGRSLDADYIYRQAATSMGEGESARALGQQTARKITAFLERLDTLLPEDIFVCIRESDRHYIDLIRQAWGKRRFYLYYEYAYWKGWRPYFITTPLWTKTFHFPTHDDILFGNVSGRGWNELTQLLGAECAWNVNRPGSEDFDGSKWRGIGTKYAPPSERKTFAERACRFWFGNEAGPLIAPVFAENISHIFIYSPDEVMKQLNIEDPIQTMYEQTEACGRAAESLDRLWELQQKSEVLQGDDYGYFLNFYMMTHGAQILATHRAHIMEANRAIQRGDRKEVEKHLSAAREALSGSAANWAEIQRKVPENRMLAPYLRKTAAPGYLSQLDLDELQEEVDDLWDRRDALMAAHTIPGWFERSCRNREIVAAATTSPINVDGRLDEPAWAAAPVIEHFMDYRIRRLESLETQARLAYDDKTLYAAFECFDPDPAGITVTMPARDEHILCDSVEILIAPRTDSKEFVHWIVDSKGTIFDSRMSSVQGGMMKNSREWNGSAQVEVARGTDRWTMEMAIPAADLGLTPKAGSTCRALLCRNIVHTRPKGEEESNSIVFLDGSNFHTVEKFASLRFGNQGETSPAPQVELTLRPVDFGHETIGDGSGTHFGGNLWIETDHNLHDFHLTAEYTDGVEPLGEKEIGSASLVQLIWRPEKPFSVLIPVEVSGVVCQFKVTSREGNWTFARRFGSPERASVPPDQLYTQGVDGQALTLPVFLSSFNPETIQLQEGTVEFWVRPHWDTVTRASGPRGSLEHTFFNLGPIRPEHLYLSNYSSLTISHSASGNLESIISNSAYEPRHVRAGIRDWRKEHWHHVALQWKLDDGGKTSMAIYVDGKLSSDVCEGNANHPNDEPLKMKQSTLPIQIGSMNTGYRPADADFDELRISSIRRYSQSFKTEKRFELDPYTITLFHFDGNLDAAVPVGVSATLGPAQ
jgi:hypothetical protein